MMVSRGHSLQTLLNDYPISTLQAMIEAAGHNNREDIAMQTQGMATAVLHGFDCGFNKGKGKILPKFMKALLKKSGKSTNIQDAEDKLLAAFPPRN